MSDVSISYAGSQIASMDDSGTKTLLTSGKYCEGNIEVIYTKPTPGVTEVEEKDVNFIDYDGTVLYSYTASEFAALTALPANPSHSGLTAQGWNWTLADAKTHVAKYKQLVIGQNYVTSDGKTRVHIRLSSGRLSPKLGLCPNGSVDVDWGDGTAHSTVPGNSLTTVVNTEHAYASPGEYVITLTVTGSFAINGTSTAGSALLWKNAGSADENRPYQSAVKKVELGENVLLGGHAFAGCLSLSAVSIPNDMSFGSNGFQGCSALKALVMRNGISRIGGNMFRDCISLQHISTPKSIASLFDSAFQNVTALQSVPAFDGVANTGTYQFYRCLSLSSIEIPESVATIGACAFNGCTGLGVIHFRNATPPTVSNSNAWTNLPTDCVIFVPYRDTNSLTEGEVMEAYLSATNYPSSSAYTYIAVATYANNVSLPSETASFFLKWYASKEDAITETNRIYYGNGSEIYARLESTLPLFTYTGTYTIVQDSAMNWRIKFLTSGTFTPANNLNVDIFAVGGGGSCDNLSGAGRRSGGGGGYTQTVTSQALTGGTSYTVTVGYGGGTEGTSASDGGPSSFGSLITANGGKKSASYNTGGAGGSGGAGCSNSNGTASAVGGSDGSNGETGESANHGGAGQGTTTREFGESSGDLYAGGGGGSPGSWAGGAGGGGAGGEGKTSGGGQDGATNTGGGGGACGGKGGSGIVIIRNAR